MRKSRALTVGASMAVVAAVGAVLMVGNFAGAKPPADSPGAQVQAETYFARFGDNGTAAELVAGRGVVSVSLETAPDWDGFYLVEFAQPVDQCAWTATLNPFFGGPTDIKVGLTWDNTVVPPENQTPDPSILRVGVSNADGSPVPPPIPGPAYLNTISVSVTC